MTCKLIQRGRTRTASAAASSVTFSPSLPLFHCLCATPQGLRPSSRQAPALLRTGLLSALSPPHEAQACGQTPPSSQQLPAAPCSSQPLHAAPGIKLLRGVAPELPSSPTSSQQPPKLPCHPLCRSAPDHEPLPPACRHLIHWIIKPWERITANGKLPKAKLQRAQLGPISLLPPSLSPSISLPARPSFPASTKPPSFFLSPSLSALALSHSSPRDNRSPNSTTFAPSRHLFSLLHFHHLQHPLPLNATV